MTDVQVFTPTNIAAVANFVAWLTSLVMLGLALFALLIQSCPPGTWGI